VLIGTWNLNNRVGKTRFRPEAASAIAALRADVVVLTEYYPQGHDNAFRAALSDAGWTYLLASKTPDVVANRILIASRLPLEPFPLCLPEFDKQFPSNILSVTIPAVGIRVIGLRIPAYTGKDRLCLLRAWDWLEVTMARLHDAPTVVLGDLNADPDSPPARGGAHFRRILANGWRCPIPFGPASYFGPSARRSKVDHILSNNGRSFADVHYVTEAGGWHLAGYANALSDHAALLACVYSD
jgi:endonuclease/exonuclease/phosphatase family metal-dependent hydrolase